MFFFAWNFNAFFRRIAHLFNEQCSFFWLLGWIHFNSFLLKRKINLSFNFFKAWREQSEPSYNLFQRWSIQNVPKRGSILHGWIHTWIWRFTYFAIGCCSSIVHVVYCAFGRAQATKRQLSIQRGEKATFHQRQWWLVEMVTEVTAADAQSICKWMQFKWFLDEKKKWKKIKKI